MSTKRSSRLYLLLLFVLLGLSACGGGGGSNGNQGGTPPPPALTSRSTFRRTDMNPQGIVYDATRKLVFATVPKLNEVVVYSSTTAGTLATIPVGDPYGIDITADASRVVVGTNTRFFVLIDPNSLQLTQSVPVPTSSSPPSTPVAMANGKVVFLTSSDQLLEWDPSNGSFNNRGTNICFGGCSLTRSPDHSKAALLSATNQICLYDSASDSFGPAAPLAWFTPIAFSPDGSRIAVFNNGAPLELLDDQFNVLATNNSMSSMTSNDGHPLDPSQLIFSRDGKTVYVLSLYGIGLAFSGQDLSLVGLFPGMGGGGLDIDETGMIFAAQTSFVTLQRGILFADASSPKALGTDQPMDIIITPPDGKGSAPSSVAISATGLTAQSWAYFGIPPNVASPASKVTASSLSMTATPPTSSQAGAVNVILTNPDGWVTVVPDGYTYGPSILSVIPNAGDPAGGTQITINGYGLESSPQVSIGGQSASVVSVSSQPPLGIPFPLQQLVINTPPGSPGTADITVTTNSGSTTASKAFQFLNSINTFPVNGTLGQVIYDKARQRLYATNSTMNEVEVFDLQAANYLPPILVGNAPQAIALAPDGSKLVVGNSGSLSIIDPTTNAVSATIDISHQKNCSAVNLLEPADVVLTSTGKAVISVYCPGASPGNGLVIVDVNSQQFGCGASTGCTQMVASMPFSPILSSSGDGSKIFLNDNSTGTGSVGLWDVGSDTYNSAFCYFGGQNAAPGGAISSDATMFANGYGILESDFNQRYLMHEIDYLAVGPDGYIGGTNTNETLSKEKLHPSGSLLYVPGWVGHLSMNPGKIDIFDVHHGRLAMQVLVPDGMVQTSDEMAIDETGSRIFLITSTGLTVIRLSEVPLSIGTVTPSSGTAGTVVTIRGSGFQAGAAVKFGATTVSISLVDENTIQLTTPSLPAGPTRITVTNGGGVSYSLDAAFTAQ